MKPKGLIGSQCVSFNLNQQLASYFRLPSTMDWVQVAAKHCLRYCGCLPFPVEVASPSNCHVLQQRQVNESLPSAAAGKPDPHHSFCFLLKGLRRHLRSFFVSKTSPRLERGSLPVTLVVSRCCSPLGLALTECSFGTSSERARNAIIPREKFANDGQLVAHRAVDWLVCAWNR